MTQVSEVPAYRYRAFISYSHQDKSWASWLHKALETYVVPKRLVGQVTAAGTIPRRLAPIFRDRDELASATDLSRKVNEALAQSANLIVICSPRAAASRWVNEEVLAFKQLGRDEQIFCLIVDGEPDASELPGRAADECFAAALRYRLDADGALSDERTEPVAADVRPGKDGKTNARLKLIAGMLGIGLDTLKRRELQRRNRRMTALASLAMVVMAITTALAITAVIARNAAERRQKQAEQLIDFMLGDLNDKLAQVSRLDIMETVDDHAMRYFQSLPTTDVTDEALTQRARALQKIGSVRLDQGHLPAAMEAYQAALKLSVSLAEAAPTNTAKQLVHAETWAFIGLTHWRQGQLDAAQQAFISAKAILVGTQVHAPNDLELRFQLETIVNNMGHVLEARGRLEEATTQYREMLAIMESLVALQPDNTEWVVELGSAHNNLGRMALLRGDLAGAIAEYAADSAIESGLSARNPKDNNQRDSMLTSRAILGRTVALTGDIEAGMAGLQWAVDTANQLMTADPDNPGFQEDVALYGTQLSRLRRGSGDLAAARVLTTRALAILDTLARQDPANSSWQRELAEARIEQAEQSRVAGRVEDARTQVQGARQILEPLLLQQPDDRVTLLAATGAKLLLAALVADEKTATTLRDDALTATRAVKSGGDDPRLLALQIEALLALDRNAEARTVIQKVWTSGYRDVALVKVLKQERIDYPVNVAFQQKMLATDGPDAGR